MAVDPSQIIQGYIARGVPPAAAIGLAANNGIESNYNPGINEIAPIVPGSRGGYGINQWTGPRRRAYEAYAQERGSALDNLDTQLDFTLHELDTTERGARDAIYSAQDPETAARLVSEKFLRPGIPHLDRRIEEARKLAGLGAGAAPQGTAAPSYGTTAANNGYQAPSTPQEQQMVAMQQQNALAQMQPPRYENALNVADFLRPVQANALSRGIING
jgi:hypothetical protein